MIGITVFSHRLIILYALKHFWKHSPHGVSVTRDGALDKQYWISQSGESHDSVTHLVYKYVTCIVRPEASSTMRALASARCTGVRLYTERIKIGTSQRAPGELSHYWTHLRGEFNNASARRALVDWYLSLFIMCEAGHQYNERPRALALLNSPLVTDVGRVRQSTAIHCQFRLVNSKLGITA